jgi:hypothetical protein
VAEMDKVAQRNVSRAEESASVAVEMNAQEEQMKGYVTELVAVVGGSKTGNGVVSAKEPRPIGATTAHVSAINHQLKARIRKILPAAKKKEEGNGKDVVVLHPKAMENKPDQVIPWMRQISRSLKKERSL